MSLANFVEHADEHFAIFGKVAHLLLNRIKSCRCSDILHRRCRISSRQS